MILFIYYFLRNGALNCESEDWAGSANLDRLRRARVGFPPRRRRKPTEKPPAAASQSGEQVPLLLSLYFGSPFARRGRLLSPLRRRWAMRCCGPWVGRLWRMFMRQFCVSPVLVSDGQISALWVCEGFCWNPWASVGQDNGALHLSPSYARRERDESSWFGCSPPPPLLRQLHRCSLSIATRGRSTWVDLAVHQAVIRPAIRLELIIF